MSAILAYIFLYYLKFTLVLLNNADVMYPLFENADDKTSAGIYVGKEPNVLWATGS